MIDPAHTSRRVAARAFVLPIVILLMLVVGLTATVMLARADVQTRDVQRMVNGYTTHHAAVGVQAAVEAWIQQLGQSDVADQIDDDGFALAILPGDGTELRLYFFDAQGGVRDNVDGLPTAAAETLLPVIESLAASLPEPPRPGETLADVAPGLFRRVGPWQIGLRSAPEPVVDAIAEAVAGATRARELATRIREAQRDDDAMTPDVLARIATETELDPEEQAAFLGLVVATGSLWEIVIDVHAAVGPGASLPQSRYRALARIEFNGAGVSTYERPPPFLTWRNEPQGNYSLTVPPEPTILQPRRSASPRQRSGGVS